MINFTKELPQNTTVIQSEHTEQYLKSSNDRANLRQSVHPLIAFECVATSEYHATVLQHYDMIIVYTST